MEEQGHPPCPMLPPLLYYMLFGILSSIYRLFLGGRWRLVYFSFAFSFSLALACMHTLAWRPMHMAWRPIPTSPSLPTFAPYHYIIISILIFSLRSSLLSKNTGRKIPGGRRHGIFFCPTTRMPHHRAAAAPHPHPHFPSSPHPHGSMAWQLAAACLPLGDGRLGTDRWSAHHPTRLPGWVLGSGLRLEWIGQLGLVMHLIFIPIHPCHLPPLPSSLGGLETGPCPAYLFLLFASRREA